MPSYETHRKIGFVFSLIFGILYVWLFHQAIPTTNYWKILLIPVVIMFYSNLPDLDHPMGKLRRYSLTMVFSTMILVAFLLYFVEIRTILIILAVTGVFGLFILRVPHRGPMHSFLFVTVLSLPLLKLGLFYTLLGIVCSYSHLIIDRLFSSTKRKVKRVMGISGETHNYNFNFKI